MIKTSKHFFRTKPVKLNFNKLNSLINQDMNFPILTAHNICAHMHAPIIPLLSTIL